MQYWMNPECGTQALTEGFTTEARFRLAASLVDRWGMVNGDDGPEDSSGRKTVKLMPVAEVVQRAFDMADAVFAEAERRGLIRPFEKSAEAVHARIGELQRVITKAEYQRRTPDAAL